MSGLQSRELAELLATKSSQIGRDPVEAAAIRRWCAAAEDANPRYWLEAEDPQLVAPPAMVATLLNRAPWAPGERQSGMELHHRLKESLGLPAAVVKQIENWFGAPVRVGDRLRSTHRISHLGEERPSGLGLGRDWSIQAVYRNQHDELVAVVTWSFHGYRPSRDPQLMPTGDGSRLADPHDAEQVPALEVDIDATRIIMAAAASGDWTKFHHDRAMATRIGLPDIILNIHGHASLVSRWVTDLVSPDSRLLRLSLRVRKPVVPGDRLRIGAHAKHLTNTAAGHLLDLALTERVADTVVATGEVTAVSCNADMGSAWEIPLDEWHALDDPGVPARQGTTHPART